MRVRDAGVALIGKSLVLMLALLFMIQGAAFDVLAEEGEKGRDNSAAEALADDAFADETVSAGDLSLADESQFEYAQLITFPFLDTKTVAFDWSFPYSDRFFRLPPDQFSLTMARGSLGVALSGFRSTDDIVKPQYETYLYRAGFYNIHAFGYDEPTSEDSLSGVIAMKKVDNFTVIAASTCGQGYDKEWAGNLKVGSGVRHQGFSSAAEILEGQIADYIKENKIKGKKKLWLNGMSRAGAVANLTAADAIDSGEYEAVYAYLFGVPRTTKEPKALKGIYNICGQYDPVPSVPLETWGYGRYGTDLYTPSQEADPSYESAAKAASGISEELEGKPFRNNPELNYQIHLVLEFMDEFFESSDEYSERFQDLLIKAMNEHSDQNEIAQILTDAISRVSTKDGWEKTGIRTFIDYMSFMAAQHARADQRQIRDGSWDPDAPLAANLALEHRPSTYVKWLFSSDDPAQILTSPTRTRRFVLLGSASVEVRGSDGEQAVYVPAGGGLISGPSKETDISSDSSLFAMRNGKETVISLPADEEYEIYLDVPGITQISYYELILSPERLAPDEAVMHVGRMLEGSVKMTAAPGRELSEPEEVTGDYRELGDTKISYSPAAVMSEELGATRYTYLSISSAADLVVKVLLVLDLLLIICLIIALRHRRKRKQGHPPYPARYVIVPHLIFIAVNTGLTLYTYYLLFPVKPARAFFAASAVFFIFLLALRGAFRHRKPESFATAAVLLVAVYMTGYDFYMVNEDSFSDLRVAVFVAMVIALSAVSIHAYLGSPAVIKRIRRMGRWLHGKRRARKTKS